MRDLEPALSLYRFADDKDVFRVFYMRALSASEDLEREMLAKLKEGVIRSLLIATRHALMQTNRI